MAVKLRIVGIQKPPEGGRMTWRYRAQAYDGMAVIWTCEHEHLTALLAQQCGNEWMSNRGSNQTNADDPPVSRFSPDPTPM